MNFETLARQKDIYLYAGDMPLDRRSRFPFIGLSLFKNDQYHIQHDMTNHIDLPDESVNIFQSEDVFEHIDYQTLPGVFNEIYRVLKPRGLFRLSMPDYRCDVLINRSRKDEQGVVFFDADGGGSYDEVNKKVIGGGHVWFPNYENVKSLIQQTNFDMHKVHFLHYYSPITGLGICNDIDYSNGFIQRTPDYDQRVSNPRRPMSIVVDLYK